MHSQLLVTEYTWIAISTGAVRTDAEDAKLLLAPKLCAAFLMLANASAAAAAGAQAAAAVAATPRFHQRQARGSPHLPA